MGGGCGAALPPLHELHGQRHAAVRIATLRSRSPEGGAVYMSSETSIWRRTGDLRTAPRSREHDRDHGRAVHQLSVPRRDDLGLPGALHQDLFDGHRELRSRVQGRDARAHDDVRQLQRGPHRQDAVLR